MKVKAKIILDLENKNIVSIKYEDGVMTNNCLGSTRMKSYLKKRVLQIPIQEFVPTKAFKDNDRTFYVTTIELDVYPIVSLNEKAVGKRPVPYTCTLFTSPMLSLKSDISWEEFSAMKREEFHKESSKNNLL